MKALKPPTQKQLEVLEAIRDGQWHERDQWPWSVVHALLRRGLAEQKTSGFRYVGRSTIESVYELQITEAGRQILIEKAIPAARAAAAGEGGA